MTFDRFSASRREILTGVTGLSLASLSTGAAAAIHSMSVATNRRFPKDFRWGVATAGYQIEGNNTNADLWLLENVLPTAFAERSGDACDSLHRYEEDIALLAGIGLNTYRFSIEWSRIEPDQGHFSIAQIDYYKRVIACCRKHNIAPAVTFIHSSAPRWFAELGGFLNPESPKLFANFCSIAAKALASGMAYAFTINEPEVTNGFRAISGGAYFEKHDALELAAHAAAAKATGSARYVTTNHPDYIGMTPQLIAAHEQGYAAIKAESPSLPVSVTLNILDFQPATESSPYQDVRRQAYGEWLDVVHRAADFAAVQIYRQIRIPGTGAPLPTPPLLPFMKPGDMYGNMSRPEAIKNVLEYVYAQVQKPIFITENGFETDDDTARVAYIDLALASLHEAIAGGIPVIGYLHWSLIDNFEWEQGYKVKYGLFSVDRTTFERMPKPSAAHYGAIARRNEL